MRNAPASPSACPLGHTRAKRLACAAGLLVAALATTTAALADITTPVLSGLSWRSGASTGDDNGACLVRLRGRTLDANTYFVGPKSFAAMLSQTNSAAAQAEARLAPLWVVSLPLLTTDTQGQFATCAAGAFDDYFRTIGANLKKAGAQGVVIRLGWEANIGSGEHPWGVDTPDQVPSFVQCWRHAALALRSTVPGALREWTSSKKTSNTSINVLDMYPGDDVVDLWGVHYYDTGPEKNTQALWDKYYNIMFNGGPWGLGSWLAAARQHGKKLAVSEWGVWQQDGQAAAQADDPVYTDNMYRFFKANASSVAYETYFNAIPNQHALCNADGTPTAYPNSAARYHADWLSGK